AARQGGLDLRELAQAAELHRGDERAAEQVALAQELGHLVLAADDLQVEVQAHLVERGPGEGVERLREREWASARGVTPVVGDEQWLAAGRRAGLRGAPVAVALEVAARPQNVELDHVHAQLDGALEAR